MNRRTLMKGSLTLGAGAVLSAQLASCNSPPAPRPATSTAVAPEASTAPTSSKMLVVYFSRAGENYYYGGRINLTAGNTEVVANIIASTLSVDVYRIKPADPYPASYDATVERNVREQDDEARPAIADRLPVLESYDTVLLGSPIWNVRPPMIMRTFIDSVDLRGKTILPFVTYAVSGIGDTIDDYTRLCPQSRIGEGLAVRGEEAQGAHAVVQDWLSKTGLLTN